MESNIGMKRYGGCGRCGDGDGDIGYGNEETNED
jgi:hypothetical protein